MSTPPAEQQHPPPPPLQQEQEQEQEQDDAPASSSDEYETDPDAPPEEFYITLDLTVPAPALAGPSTNPYTNTVSSSSGPKKSTQVLGASRWQYPRHGASGGRGGGGGGGAVGGGGGAHVPKWARAAATRKDRLQILGLDSAGSEQVLVNYQNRIWAGSWAHTVGTEMFISAPQHSPHPPSSSSSPSASASSPAAAVGAGGADGVEDGEKEAEVEVRDVPRISGGGYYYSERDSSLANAFVQGRRGASTRKPVHSSGMGVEGIEAESRARMDPEAGRVVGLSRERVHFVPVAVKAHEWSSGQRVQGKSDFLRRLEKIQIEKGELADDPAGVDRWRQRRRRKKRKDSDTIARGDEAAGGNEGGEVWVWESCSDDPGGENDGDEDGDGDREAGRGGYFTPGWDKNDETRRPVDKDGDVEMGSAPSPEK